LYKLRFIIVASAYAIAEALVFGKKAGLDPQKSTRSCALVPAAACSSKTGCRACWRAISCRGARLTSRTRTKSSKPSFAKHLGVPLLLASVTQQVYQMARAAGLNKEDGSSIIKVFERMAGVTIGGDDD